MGIVESIFFFLQCGKAQRTRRVLHAVPFKTVSMKHEILGRSRSAKDTAAVDLAARPKTLGAWNEPTKDWLTNQ